MGCGRTCLVRKILPPAYAAISKSQYRTIIFYGFQWCCTPVAVWQGNLVIPMIRAFTTHQHSMARWMMQVLITILCSRAGVESWSGDGSILHRNRWLYLLMHCNCKNKTFHSGVYRVAHNFELNSTTPFLDRHIGIWFWILNEPSQKGRIRVNIPSQKVHFPEENISKL